MSNIFPLGAIEGKAIEIANEKAIALGLRPTGRTSAVKQDVEGLALLLREAGVVVSEVPKCAVCMVSLEHDARQFHGSHKIDEFGLDEDAKEFLRNYAPPDTATRYFWVGENGYVCRWPSRHAEIAAAIEETLAFG
jgi:hypothetical protein